MSQSQQVKGTLGKHSAVNFSKKAKWLGSILSRIEEAAKIKSGPYSKISPSKPKIIIKPANVNIIVELYDEIRKYIFLLWPKRGYTLEQVAQSVYKELSLQKIVESVTMRHFNKVSSVASQDPASPQFNWRDPVWLAEQVRQLQEMSVQDIPTVIAQSIKPAKSVKPTEIVAILEEFGIKYELKEVQMKQENLLDLREWDGWTPQLLQAYTALEETALDNKDPLSSQFTIIDDVSAEVRAPATLLVKKLGVTKYMATRIAHLLEKVGILVQIKGKPNKGRGSIRLFKFAQVPQLVPQTKIVKAKQVKRIEERKIESAPEDKPKYGRALEIMLVIQSLENKVERIKLALPTHQTAFSNKETEIVIRSTPEDEDIAEILVRFKPFK